MTTSAPTLSVRDLRVGIPSRGGLLHAVDGVSFDVMPGETLGVVGESGSGKSVSMLAMLGLLTRPPSWVVEGRAELRGLDLLRMSPRELQRMRGRDVAMVFQNPSTSLNPVFTIGDQLVEALRVHNSKLSRRAARERVMELLATVGIPAPERRFAQYPHEFSGGMTQRVVIAMALANSPALIIADEPTTALDVTIQAQILQVLKRTLAAFGTSLVLITHNLGLVAEIADRVIVMYAGRVMEAAAVEPVFHAPRHPYTVGLMRSVPRLGRVEERMVQIPGQPPTITALPSGCPFHPRCPLARDRCRTDRPELLATDGEAHRSACHFWSEVGAEAKVP